MQPKPEEPLNAILLPEPATGHRGLMLLGCGFLALVIVVFVGGIVGLISLAGRNPQAAKPVETSEEKRQSLVAGFALDNRLEHPERREVERLLQRIVRASQQKNSRQFRTLVNFNKLGDTVLAHPLMPRLGYTDRLAVRRSLKENESFEPVQKLRLVDLQTIDDRHLLAFVFSEGDNSLTEPWRFWLVRDGNQWQLYDWDRVEFGYTVADRHAIYQAAGQDSQYDQYTQSDFHVEQATKHFEAGETAAAEEELRRAARCKPPGQLEHIQQYIIMLKWLHTGNREEIIKSCQTADPASRSPGFKLQLAIALQNEGKHQEALQAADEYERAAGFHPEIYNVRAQALEALERRDEALAAYEALHRYSPHGRHYFEEIYRLLPEGSKQKLIELVKQSEKPAEAAYVQARSLLPRHDDFATVQQLAAFVEEVAPQSTELFKIRALLLSHDGQLEQAAALYRQAAEISDPQAKKGDEDDDYEMSDWDLYLNAMQEADKLAEAIQTHPNPRKAFQYYVVGFEDDEATVSETELQTLVTARLAVAPQDPAANCFAGILAYRDSNGSAADKHFEAALASTEEETESQRSMARQYRRFNWLQQGKPDEAIDDAVSDSESFRSLAFHCKSQGFWDELKQLIARYRSQPDSEKDVWLDYYDAKLAAQTKNFAEANRLVKQAREKQKTSNQEYLNYTIDSLAGDIATQKHGLVEAFRQQAELPDSFQQFHHRALIAHDWQAAAQIVEILKSRHPDSPHCLAAAVEQASQQGDDEKVVALLQPWPGNDKFDYEWEGTEARETLIKSLIRLQRLDEALAAANDHTGDKFRLQAIVHLARGDGAAFDAAVKDQSNNDFDALQSLCANHPREVAAACRDERLKETLQKHSFWLPGNLAAGIVLLSAANSEWTAEQIQQQFQTAQPECRVSQPQQHLNGTTYQIVWPGAEAWGMQLTIGKGAYIATPQLRESSVTEPSVRLAVGKHHRWLAIEMLEPNPLAAGDASWLQLRKLAATLCDQETVALGVRLPGSYSFEFCRADDKSPERLRSDKFIVHPEDALSGYLPLPKPERDDRTLEIQVKRLQRDWSAAANASTTEEAANLPKLSAKLCIALEDGHRLDHQWLRVIDMKRGNYGAFTFKCEVIDPSPAAAKHLPTGHVKVPRYSVIDLKRE